MGKRDLSYNEWVHVIQLAKGETTRPAKPPRNDIGKNYEYLDGAWYKTGSYSYKKIRDNTAKEMRQDGWRVVVKTNKAGWFLTAKRVK